MRGWPWVVALVECFFVLGCSGGGISDFDFSYDAMGDWADWTHKGAFSAEALGAATASRSSKGGGSGRGSSSSSHGSSSGGSSSTGSGGGRTVPNVTNGDACFLPDASTRNPDTRFMASTMPAYWTSIYKHTPRDRATLAWQEELRQLVLRLEAQAPSTQKSNGKGSKRL